MGEDKMAWTDDRVEILTKLWGEGLSASQIARELGDVTRNAVIGKVHRLGIHFQNINVIGICDGVTILTFYFAFIFNSI